MSGPCRQSTKRPWTPTALRNWQRGFRRATQRRRHHNLIGEPADGRARNVCPGVCQTQRSMHHMPNSYAKHPVFTLMLRALVQTIYRALLTSAVSGIGHRIHTLHFYCMQHGHGMSHHSTHTTFKVALNNVHLHGSAYCCKGNNSLDISGGQRCGMMWHCYMSSSCSCAHSLQQLHEANLHRDFWQNRTPPNSTASLLYVLATLGRASQRMRLIHSHQHK